MNHKTRMASRPVKGRKVVIDLIEDGLPSPELIAYASEVVRHAFIFWLPTVLDAL